MASSTWKFKHLLPQSSAAFGAGDAEVANSTPSSKYSADL